jgi:hypothetical protein
VVSDTGLWRNRAIGQFDNAWLLWYLNQGRQVVMQYRAPAQGLLAQIAAYPATLAWALIVLVLLAWFGATHWHGSLHRRRARLRPLAGARRQEAGRAHLLRALREDIQRCAGRHYLGFNHRPVAEQWQLLATLTGTSTAAVAQALRPHPGEQLGAKAFRQQVAQLQLIRNAL